MTVRHQLEKLAYQTNFVMHQDVTPTFSERLAGDWTRFRPKKALAGATKGAVIGGGVGTALGHLLDQKGQAEGKAILGTYGAVTGATIGGLHDYVSRYQKNVRRTRLAGVVGVGALGGALAYRALRGNKK